MTDVVLAAPQRRLNAERIFYLSMAWLMAAGLLAGFAPSWFLRPWLYQPTMNPITPLVLVHSLVFTGWLILFVTQVSLISAGRVALHRQLGISAMGFALVMLVLGFMTAVSSAVRGTGPPPFPADQFLAVPLFALLGPAIMIPLGLANRKRDSQAHKRYMLLSMTTFIGAGFGRLTFWPFVIGDFIVPSLFVGALAAWDIHSRGKLHPATMTGGAIALLAICGPLLVWQTESWLWLANSLMDWWR